MSLFVNSKSLNLVKLIGALGLVRQNGPAPRRHLLGESQRITSLFHFQDVFHQLLFVLVFILLDFTGLHHFPIRTDFESENLNPGFARKNQRFYPNLAFMDLVGPFTDYCGVF